MFQLILLILSFSYLDASCNVFQFLYPTEDLTFSIGDTLITTWECNGTPATLRMWCWPLDNSVIELVTKETVGGLPVNGSYSLPLSSSTIKDVSDRCHLEMLPAAANSYPFRLSALAAGSNPTTWALQQPAATSMSTSMTVSTLEPTVSTSVTSTTSAA